ncbi:MAG: tryptophan halogenase family protein [Parvularcula sp.]|jgi:tryptophan halogenase|nr:tryptophan halogenase family protein [Parvularcula sp.]
MRPDPVRKVAIVGGGTAGWITAAAMVKLLPGTVKIVLIESDAIGTVGVGEATIPQIRRLNMILGLDEDEFIRETKGTFKLGIEFVNWGQHGERYLHTFGDIGLPLAGLAFHHYWLKARADGRAGSLWDYSLHQCAANGQKFGRLERVGQTGMTGLAYAYHFDAGLYAAYLRRYAEPRGVTRIEGRIERTEVNPANGFIDAVHLADGTRVDADLFIDCSGFRGLLIGEALGVDYRDWSHWLPCNRAAAVPSARTEPLLPYTRATAREAGWQWRIPLQHRTGNGHVFCNSFTSDDEAIAVLMNGLDGEALAEPRLIGFQTGRREHFWFKNCVSIGLSSGFLEPLESTSIHLIQSNVSRLIEHFPDRGMNPAVVGEYNRLVGQEYEAVRDFLILHYKLNQRTDTEFWRACAAMDIPSSLQEKMALFEEAGVIYRQPDDLFREASWLQVMIGQNLMPKRYHPMAERVSPEQLAQFLASVKDIVGQAIDPLPTHAETIRQIAEARA